MLAMCYGCLNFMNVCVSIALGRSILQVNEKFFELKRDI